MNPHPEFRSRTSWNVILPLAALILLGPVDLSLGQRRTARPTRPPATPTKPAESQPRFKAIWEPINYSDDLTFQDVFFANDQVGWISGGLGWKKGGFILQTKDGGDHWAVQLGDPHSSDPAITHLRFLDANHGWAVQENKLVRTSDGANWEDAGSLPRFVPLADYNFTSPTHGVFVGGYPTEGTKIFVTQDGGQTWKQVFQCETKVEVNGLMRNTGCHLFALQFPSPLVGYAVGGSFNDGPGQGFFVTAKTEDGGESWRVIYTFATIPHAETVFFRDASNGVTRNNDNKFYATMDGGVTWKGATGSGEFEKWKIAFADREVGWSGGERRLSYTTDGGLHWNSRDLHLPANVQAFCFPSRHRGYVVGQHGMIYRYRVVPVDYNVPGMLDAPMMPGLTTKLDGIVGSMRQKAKALQAKLQAAQAKTTGSLLPASLLTSYSGAADGGGQEAQAPAGTESEPGSGFVQDTGSDPVSQTIQDCCVAEVQDLQTGVGSFLHEVPAFSTSWRPLNLILAGLRLASDLLNKAQGVRSAFIALKTAKSLPDASAALQNMMTNLDGASQTITSRFQNMATLTWAESAASTAGAVAGTVAPAASQTAAVPSPTTATNTAQSAKTSETKKQDPSVDQIKKSAKKKLGIKFP